MSARAASALPGSWRETIRPLKHLNRVHKVVTVGELDAVGWNIVNSYRKQMIPKKLTRFFRKSGRNRNGPLQSEAAILPFRKA